MTAPTVVIAVDGGAFVGRLVEANPDVVAVDTGATRPVRIRTTAIRAVTPVR